MKRPSHKETNIINELLRAIKIMETGARVGENAELFTGYSVADCSVNSSSVSYLLSPPSLSYTPMTGACLWLPPTVPSEAAPGPSVTYVQCQISSQLALSPALVFSLTSQLF